MVLWYHLILTAYGFWLPNDPRGSWSEFAHAWELQKFGPATKVNDKRSYAHDPHDVRARLEAKQALKYPPVRFEGRQRELVGIGFGDAVNEGGYVVPACCIGHDHAHLIVERHERTIEKIAGHLRSKATMALNRANAHPLAEFRTNDGKVPTPWAEGSWSVFINEPAHVRAAVAYVERHPLKEGLPFIAYPFITPLRAV